MNPQDLIKFKQALKTVASSLEAGEKFLIAPLAIRLTRAATENPGDQTILAVASYLQKRAQKENLISRADLDNAYNTYYTVNNRCSEYLSKELSKQASLPEPSKMIRHEQEGSLMDSVVAKMDKGFVNALNSALDKDVEYKPWSTEMAAYAKETCMRELGTYDFKPVSLEVVAGSEDALLCMAAYETPKGKVSVIVPIEIASERNKLLLPTMFVNSNGFHNLSEESLSLNIKSACGKRYDIQTGLILDLIKTAKHGVKAPENEVERIVSLANVAKDNAPVGYDFNGVFTEVDEARPNVEVKNSPEMESFAARLGSAKGIAEFTYGRKAIDAGRDMLLKSMANFGYKAQISVIGADVNHVVYAASLGTSGIKVAIKFENGSPVYPQVAVAGGEVGTFDAEGVGELFGKNDGGIAAVSSEFGGNKPSELIETVKAAMNEGNLEKAENALNVLSNSGDQGAFKYAFELYHEGLKDSGKPVVKSASKEHKCSMQIKTATSQHVVCGHLNLPLHKVCQDAHGDCQPLHRKNQEYSTGDVLCNTTKLYFE